MEQIYRAVCWKIAVLIAVIFTFLCTGVAADTRFILSNNYATWPQADMFCKSSRRSLAILDVPDLQRIFDNDIKPNPGEKLWVGRYLGYTSIVSMEGCYSNMTMMWRRARALPNNYLVNCLKMCPDTSHIGLQNEVCYCIDTIPTRASPLPPVSCRSRCPGEQALNLQYLTQCGSTTTNSVAIYRKVKDADIKLDEDYPNMGECIAYNTRTRTWQPGECTLQRIFTCDRKPCPTPIQQCMFESTSPSNWYNGRFRCESNSGYLATVNLTTSRFFDFRRTLGDGVYWTGLHRKQAIAWKYGDTNEDIIRSDKCVAVLKRPDGSWDWQLDWCDRKYKFVCLQEFTTTTQGPLTRPTRPRTTPTPVVTTPRPTIRTTLFPFTTSSSTTTTTTVTPNAQPVNDNGAVTMTSFIHLHIVSLFLCLYMFK